MYFESSSVSLIYWHSGSLPPLKTAAAAAGIAINRNRRLLLLGNIRKEKPWRLESWENYKSYIYIVLLCSRRCSQLSQPASHYTCLSLGLRNSSSWLACFHTDYSLVIFLWCLAPIKCCFPTKVSFPIVLWQPPNCVIHFPLANSVRLLFRCIYRPRKQQINELVLQLNVTTRMQLLTLG